MEKMTEGSALQVEDRMNIANNFLTEQTKLKLAKKATQLTLIEDGEVYNCIYLGVRVKTTNLTQGVERICNMLNALSEKDLIHSALSTVISLDLVKLPLQALNCAVLCYVLVPARREAEAKELVKDLSFDSGSEFNVKAINDLSLDLNEGEFGAEIRITIALGMQTNPKEILDREIEQYLKVLPKGTIVKEINPCGIIGLYYPYEVIFHNSLLQKVKKVDLSYTREIAIINDQTIKEFNLFTGIRFFDKDGKELYK